MKRLINSVWSKFVALSGRMKIIVGLALAAFVGFAIWAVFFYFAFQTYFIDDEVNEAGPIFDSGATQVEQSAAPTARAADAEADTDATPVDTGTPVTNGDAEPAQPSEPAQPPQTSEPDVAATSEPEASAASAATPAADSSGTQAGVTSSQPEDAVGAIEGDELSEELMAEMDEAMAQEGMPAEMPADEAMPEMPQVRVEAAGGFISRSHPTRGQAEVLGDGTGQRFLRFEEFRTDNGPDLNVYLSAAAPDAPAGQFDDDFVDLGDLKGNVGDQNYEIPRDLDLNHYSTVVVWCVRFSVAFGAADLLPS